MTIFLLRIRGGFSVCAGSLAVRFFVVIHTLGGVSHSEKRDANQ